MKLTEFNLIRAADPGDLPLEDRVLECSGCCYDGGTGNGDLLLVPGIEWKAAAHLGTRRVACPDHPGGVVYDRGGLFGKKPNLIRWRWDEM